MKTTLVVKRISEETKNSNVILKLEGTVNFGKVKKKAGTYYMAVQADTVEDLKEGDTLITCDVKEEFNIVEREFEVPGETDEDGDQLVVMLKWLHLK